MRSELRVAIDAIDAERSVWDDVDELLGVEDPQTPQKAPKGQILGLDPAYDYGVCGHCGSLIERSEQ